MTNGAPELILGHSIVIGDQFRDGDMFDSSMEPRMGGHVGKRAHAMGTEGDLRPPRHQRSRNRVLSAIKALTDTGDDIDFVTLRRLVKAMSS